MTDRRRVGFLVFEDDPERFREGLRVGAGIAPWGQVDVWVCVIPGASSEAVVDDALEEDADVEGHCAMIREHGRLLRRVSGPEREDGRARFGASAISPRALSRLIVESESVARF